MASSITLNSYTSYQGRYLYVTATQRKDIANNKNYIDWTLYSAGATSTYYTTGPTTLMIGGQQAYYKSRTSWSSEAFPAKAGSVSGTVEVPADNQGKCSVTVSLSTAIYTSTVTTNSMTWNLDDIPRQATLTAAPNFNDEQNPTITYSNPAGDAVTSLKACISWTGADDIKYRDISKTGSSYTFNLTEEERNALRWASINSPNLTVKFYVTTVIGGVTYYSTLDKIMTIINADPILAPTAIDTGGYSVPLTGDVNNKVIKGFNYMDVAVNATAQKGASIKSQSITCGGQIINGGSGGFNNVESGTFIFSATDSRGFTKTIQLEKELIPYIKLTCNLKAPNPTPAGKTTLTISGNFYRGSFGATGNNLEVYYKLIKDGATDSGWQYVEEAAYNITSNGTYTADVPLTGLDYKATYTVRAMAIDKCYTKQTTQQKIKSITVFDWGENDLNVNGTLKVNNVSIIDLIYPVGSIYMSMANTSPEILFGGEWEQISGRFLLGAGTAKDNTEFAFGNLSNSGYVFGAGGMGGAYRHTLTDNEMPAHSHAIFYPNASGEATDYIGFPSVGSKNTWWAEASRTGNSGSSIAHNNMPPYLTVYIWRRIS